ncbi:MAG: hypothetical protein D9C04_04750 [Nitrosopumilus sp. B06]|nr:MAG: hypothetical protein EB828_06670 [Nitrosopumilus sp. D6]RNJ79521.1 MAG: hypothetical protein D9C04_04750 [Nitrosopumilus sp. B06]
MERSRKVGLIVLFVAGMAVFGYTQYASASQIQVNIAQSELLGEDGDRSRYDVILEFENPSLLLLTAGQTKFEIMADGQKIGSGQLEPFTLPPLGSAHATGTFETDSDTDKSQNIKISGTTEYDILVATIKIPFVHQPTEEQAREFIHQG